MSSGTPTFWESVEDLQTFVKLESITSYSSRNEPTLILEETAGRVTLALLIST